MKQLIIEIEFSDKFMLKFTHTKNKSLLNTLKK